jgi:3-oxoacyl-ACP reductase-like protein
VYRVLVGKPEVKRPLGRPRRRWEDNIKAELQEVGCGGMDWIERLRIETGGGHL